MLKGIKKHYKLIIGLLFAIGLVSVLVLRLNKADAANGSLRLSGEPLAVYANDDEEYSSAIASTMSPNSNYLFVLFRNSTSSGYDLLVYRRTSSSSYSLYQTYRRLPADSPYDITYYTNGSSSGHFILIANGSVSGHNIIRYRLPLTEGSGTDMQPLDREFFNTGFNTTGIAWNNDKNKFYVVNSRKAIYEFNSVFSDSTLIRKTGAKGAPRTGGTLGFNLENSGLSYYNNKIYATTNISSLSVCENYVEGHGLDSSICSAGANYFSNNINYASYIATFDADTGDFVKLYNTKGAEIRSWANAEANFSTHGLVREIVNISFYQGQIFLTAQGEGIMLLGRVVTEDFFEYKKLNVVYRMNGGDLVSPHGDDVTSSGDTILFSGNSQVLMGETGAKINGGKLPSPENSDGINIERNGYHIVRGSEWRDDSGKVFSIGTPYNVSDLADVSINNKTINLFVNWVANKYNVAFAANGGTGTMIGQQMTYDVQMTLNPNTFTRVGYTFRNWNTKAAGGGVTYFDRAVVKNLTPENNGTVVLYAQWIPIQYHLVLNNNDSTDTKRDISLPYDQTFSLSNYQPTRNGYTLEGWALTPDASTPTYGKTAGVLNLANQNGATVNLYAVWKPIQYAISFNTNGGNSINSILRYYDQPLGNLPTPSKDGYLFNGWYTNENTLVTPETLCKGNMSLQARWTAITYTIKMNNNDGTTKAYNKVLNYDQTYNLSGYQPTRDGYILKGWATSSSASAPTYDINSTVSKLTIYDNAIVGLYAVWDASDCIINFNPLGGDALQPRTVKYGQAIGTLPIPTRQGYLFEGWYTSSSGGTRITASTVITGNTTFFARWVAISYNIHYDANGGTGTIENQTAHYDSNITLANNSFERSGYIFETWNTKPDGTGTSYSAGQTVSNLSSENNGIVTLYAKWSEVLTYTITYELDGGGISGANPVSYDSLSTSITLNNPTKEGYTFIGWTGSNGTTPSMEVTIAAGTTGNLHYEANYRINKYKVIFITNEGPKTYELDYNSEITEIPTVSKKGYTFIGWFDENGAELGTRVPAHDRTYSPDYRPNKYKVTFDSNGGTGTMDEQILTYDKKVNLFKNLFEKTSYYFGGWNTKKDGSGKTYIDEEEVLNLLSEDDDGMVLYAIWTSKPNNNDGNNDNNEPSNPSTSGDSSSSTDKKKKKNSTNNPKTGTTLNVILVTGAIIGGLKVKKYASKHRRLNKI